MSEPVNTNVKVEIPEQYKEGHLRWLDKDGYLWVQKREKLSPEEKAKRLAKRKAVESKLQAEGAKLRQAVSIALKNARKNPRSIQATEALNKAEAEYGAFKEAKKQKRKEMLA